MINGLKKVKSVHFIGIGGIGISAIARMMLLEGKVVTGSDRSTSKVTEELCKAGAKIMIGQRAENIPKHSEFVVYTVAVSEDNPELVEAKRRGLPTLSYPQTLEEISREKFTIAVSGTHGKTTTTSMIAKVMIDGGLDPTVIVGSLMKLPDGGESNYIAGRSKYLVVEADEYKKSFHNLYPTILVINNLDLDHLDFYKDLSDIQDSFRTLALRVPSEGLVITDLSKTNVLPVLRGVRARVIDYHPYLDPKLKLNLPGLHNRSNAAVALALAEVLGIERDLARKSLESYEGTWRRFEFKGEMPKGALVYDDYAHNPQKLEAAIQGAREAFPNKKLIVVFQPHLFSRTKFLFQGFVKALRQADVVIISKIYPAREEFDPTISSPMLATALEGEKVEASALDSFPEIKELVQEKYDSGGNLILILGAGDINELGEGLVHVRE
jgi:UDP-N-acetylmuramate--alanine ligase